MNLQEQTYRIKQMMGVLNENLDDWIMSVKLSESKRKSIQWVKPDFDTEENEFYGHFLLWLEDDVIRDEIGNFSYDRNDLMDKVRSFYEDAKVEILSDKEWEKLYNTDSWNIKSMDDLYEVIHGMWGRTKERIMKHSVEPIMNGGKVETPIIAYVEGHPPVLVAGNTRLSVCRMLGITPKVTKLKIDLDEFASEKNEMKEGELTEKCWPGYTQKGMKTMFGKRYPNCVKKTK